MSVKRLVYIQLILLATALLGTLGWNLFASIETESQARLLPRLSDNAEQLAKAGRLWSVERAALSIALNDPEPVDDSISQLSQKVRLDGDYAFKQAASSLTTLHLPIDTDQKKKLEEALANVRELRETVDSAVSGSMKYRDQALHAQWIEAMDALISTNAFMITSLGNHLASPETANNLQVRSLLSQLSDTSNRIAWQLGNPLNLQQPISQQSVLDVLHEDGQILALTETVFRLSPITLQKPSDELKQALADYLEAKNTILKQSDGDVLDYTLPLADWMEKSLNLQEAIGNLSRKNSQALDILLQARADAAHSSLTLYLITMLVVLGLVIAAFILTIQRVARPVERMGEAMEAVMNGDTSHVVPYATRKDEIGQMAKALEVFKWNAAERLTFHEKQTTEREKSDTERKDLMHTLADQLDRNMSRMLERLQDETGDTTKSFSELLSQLEAVANESYQLSESATQGEQGITAALPAFSASQKALESINDLIHRASQFCRKAVQQSLIGSERAAILSTTSSDTGLLAQVNDLVEQIEVLAVNIAIEVARAGDAGTGFIPISSQVKSLAEEAAQLQNAFQTLLQQLQSSSEEVTSSNGKVAEVLEKLEEISSEIASTAEREQSNLLTAARQAEKAAYSTHTITEGLKPLVGSTKSIKLELFNLYNDIENTQKEYLKLRTELERFLSELRHA